jgi:hypothetical protein
LKLTNFKGLDSPVAEGHLASTTDKDQSETEDSRGAARACINTLGFITRSSELFEIMMSTRHCASYGCVAQF